jgi:hypothetical protein
VIKNEERVCAMKKIMLLSFFIRTALPLEAQEMQGMVNSNYAGVSAICMNPSLMTDSKLYLDINFLATDIFFQTDMNKNAYGSFRLNGPGFMLNKGSHAFAFTDAARTAISYRKIDLGNVTVNGQEIDEYKVAGLAWAEFGLSYAYIYHRAEKNVWSAGATLKILGGAGGAYFANTGNGYTLSNSFSNNLQNLNFSDKGMSVGKGVGIDLGITYQKKEKPVNLLNFKKLCQQKFGDYVYRAGISIIDLGSIRFSNNVNNTHFNKNLTGYIPNSLVDSSYYELLADSNIQQYNSSLNKESFSMNLPAAVCLQFDYHYKNNWYINGTFVQGLNFSNSFVRRPTMLAVTPRYEKRWLEADLPLSVSDMKYFRLGLALRFWNFVIGTDNLLGSLGVGSNASFNIYTSLKINFQKGRCVRKKGVSMFDS